MRTTKIKKGTGLHALNQSCMRTITWQPQRIKGLGLFGKGLVLTSPKYLYVQTQTNIFRKVLVEFVLCYQRTL